MDNSSAQQHQETLESMLVCTKPQPDQKKPRPQPEHALKCPRCDSTNTKFCYYNNYSLTQPRYFCKSCRRYWTKGGTLRNVPVGGGCRKNKRSSSSSKLRTSQDQSLSSHPSPLSRLGYDSSDLSLAFARLQKQASGEIGLDSQDHSMMGNPSGALNGLFGNFAEAQSGFQNLYYGVGSGNFGNLGGSLENTNNHNHHEEMGVIGYEQDHSTRDTIMKQECGEQRVLWGFPWQIGVNENMGGDFENSGRESWNGIGATWHGLLNSPLM